MTTVAHVKNLVKPLLDRHCDLALVGRWVYVKPVHHFARAILVDRMLDPLAFRPQWAVVHLFQPRRSFPLSWGEWLYNESSATPGLWKISDPDISSALIQAIERNALPLLRAMNTLDAYIAFVSQHFFRHQLFDWPSAKVIVDIALGDLDAARTVCAEKLASLPLDFATYDEDGKEKYRRLAELCARLAADDRPGLAQLLHDWEAMSVKNLKIEHLWEPTPFPLEMKPQTMTA